MLAMIMQPTQFSKWGGETLEMIRRDYYLPERKLYAESVISGKKPSQVAFNWGCGVMLSAFAAGAKADEQYKPWLREFADESHAYWNPAGPVAGYDVLPMPKPVDRYYDDNAWMVMALCETYDVLGDKKYLTWAREALLYVLSGEDSKLGGGIYWRESDKKSKNTCSNGPSAAACIAVYQRTKEKAFLNRAAELYRWTKTNLQDPSDSLYWDSMNLEGKVDRTKWSYNTALMIRTAANLYRETKELRYHDDVLKMVEASKKKWLKNGRYQDGARFAHLLLESWLIAAELVPESKFELKLIADPIANLRETARNSTGHYVGNWGSPQQTEEGEFPLIDQASFARACFMLGLSRSGTNGVSASVN